MGDFLNAYLQNTSFARWLFVTNKYTRVTDDNVAQYYVLYARRQLCEQKKCYECAGLYPNWSTEEDILSGNIQNKTCLMYAAEQQAKAGLAYAERIQVPAAYKNVNIHALPLVQPDVKQLLQHWVDHFPNNDQPGLYLYANKHNTGRTAIAWWLFYTLALAGKLPQGGMLYTNSMLLKHMQADGFEQTTMKQAMSCTILLLDDFGLERYTDAVRAMLADILEYRNWHQKPTVITSMVHCALYAWPEGPDQSLVSKLQKTCKEITIDFEETPL